MDTKQTIYNILASMKSEPMNVELNIFEKEGAMFRDKAYAAASIAYDQVAKAKANLQKSIVAHKGQLSSYDKFVSGLEQKLDNLPVTGNKTTDQSAALNAKSNVVQAKKQRDLMERQMKGVQKMLSDLSSFKLIS